MWRIVVVVAVVVLSSSTAGADPDPTATRIAMQDYFAGEQTGGIILVGMGVGGLATGALLVRQSSPTLRGASYPLLGLGLAHLAAGIFIYISSANRIEQFDAAITKDTAVFVRDEQPRMRGVSTQFLVLKIVEGVLGAGGIAMAAIGHTTNRPPQGCGDRARDRDGGDVRVRRVRGAPCAHVSRRARAARRHAARLARGRRRTAHGVLDGDRVLSR